MPSGRPMMDSESGGKKKGGRHFPTVIVLCALLVMGAVWVVLRHRAASAGKSGALSARPGTGPVPVVAGMVARKDVPIYLDGLGTVQAFNTVTVHARVDGQLEKIGFVEGHDVHAGDMLAQIDPAPFQTQVEQNEAKKAQDEAQLANARLELKRDTELLGSKVVSQSVYDAQEALVNQLDAAVKADQAAIDNAKVQLAYTTVLAPIDGRTGIRLVDAGNIVHANDANGIVVITQLRPISLVFTLPEQSLEEIQAHLSAGELLSVLAVDRDNNKTLSEGKLAVVDNQIDTTTGTIRLKATFPNDNLRLWPGQFVNARLLLTTRKDGIVVPAQAIQRGPEGAYAFVIEDDMSAQVRPVKVARIDQEQALIDDGLRPGERVVVDGQYKLQPGSQVKLSDSTSPTQTNRKGPAGKAAEAKEGP